LIEKQISDQSNLHDFSGSELMSKVFVAKHAIKEFIPVVAIAAACLFLAAAEAGTITGIALPLDAGWPAQ
jgi:3-hydroxybutyrate dehydrogenase